MDVLAYDIRMHLRELLDFEMLVYCWRFGIPLTVAHPLGYGVSIHSSFHNAQH